MKVTETPEILFARLKVEEIVEKAEAMYAARRAEAEAPVQEEAPAEDVIDIEAKEEIEYGDFAKLQFLHHAASCFSSLHHTHFLSCVHS